MNTQYLGDRLYASHDGHQFKLMANSHLTPTDTVYLEPQVVEAFLRFIESALNLTISIKAGNRNTEELTSHDGQTREEI